ncbi:MAG TPA: NADH-quinone oxidoreductase subunit N [Candidatus Didemnitutus sp.]|nr:NADH-quinone oxidoreductase subunit N [Candidatus Didemnitutus sp.]
MPTEHLVTIAESNHWGAIVPELMLACGALLLLVAEILLPKSQQKFIPHLATLIQAAALLGVVMNFGSASNWSHESLFGGLIRLTAASQVARVFFLSSSLLVTFLAGVCLPLRRVPRVEFYHLVMVITAAMMLLAESDHFVMFFVSLEALTIGFYILVSYYRESPLTLEAGLKYLVMGSLSSGILLFGIVLLYGAVGRVMDYSGNPHTGFEFSTAATFLEHQPDNFLALVGVLLILSGVAFKIGAFPFQVWIPDVYQGAPTPVTAFLAVSSKAAGFAVLLILVQNVFAPLQAILVPVLSAMAAATIIFGNLSALSQRNAKRLMGLSGVSHAGFLLIGVTASMTVAWAANAVWFYLFTYMLASMAVFGVMAHVAGDDDAGQELDSYDQLARQRPLLAAVLAVGVGSLAGIPPLAGFIGKLLVFIAAYQAHLYGLLVIAIIGVVMSIYYYFGWIKAAFFATWQLPSAPEAPAAPTRRAPAFIPTLILSGLALATILIGLWQSPITSWLPIR